MTYNVRRLIPQIISIHGNYLTDDNKIIIPPDSKVDDDVPRVPYEYRRKVYFHSNGKITYGPKVYS